MDEQSAAIVNFFGHTFGQLKEIDKNIDAVGSNVKFGGRSAEVEKALKGFVQQMQNPSAAPVASPAIEHSPVYTQAMPVMVAPVVQQHNNSAEEQLELKFSASDKDVLNDIYNVLYDIRKLLSETIELQKQQTTDAPKKEKKQSMLAQCCLCGSNAKGKKVSEKLYTVTCESCKNTEEGDSKTIVETHWNNKNKQL
jgi:hypothetical protein